ncbi:hypothetical protein ACIB24_18215 [Spongisporangium articulatum]|uniref:Uncharacterized protein n=1 Tax=Spongisporangium articulatum TaxID=3362603 RepID=A0ABW8ARL2_9ACTN
MPRDVFPVDATEGTEVHLVAPRDEVWARIAAATGVPVDARPEEVRRTVTEASVTVLAPELDPTLRPRRP